MRRYRWTGIYPLVGPHYDDNTGSTCLESSYFPSREESTGSDPFIPNADWSWHVHCGRGPCPRCGAEDLDLFHPNLPLMSMETNGSPWGRLNVDLENSTFDTPVFLMHYRNNRGAIDYMELYSDIIMGPILEGAGDILIVHSYTEEEMVRRIWNRILNGFSDDVVRAAAEDRIKFIPIIELFPDGEWLPSRS
jgi:hypothetical protein